jgi:hypothetical protein
MLCEEIHPKVVQELMGHASVTVTLDTYSHVLPTMQGEEAGKVDSILSQNRLQYECSKQPPSRDGGLLNLLRFAGPSRVARPGFEPGTSRFSVACSVFAAVLSCSEITCQSTKYLGRMFLVVRQRSWRVGGLIGVSRPRSRRTIAKGLLHKRTGSRRVPTSKLPSRDLTRLSFRARSSGSRAPPRAAETDRSLRRGTSSPVGLSVGRCRP